MDNNKKHQQEQKNPSQFPGQKQNPNMPGKQEQHQPNKGNNPAQKKPGSNW